MRRAMRHMLAVAAVILIVAGAAAGQPPEWNKFTHSKYGFSLNYPAEWVADYGDDEPLVFVALGPRSSSAEPFRINVNVTTEKVPADFTVQRYYELGESQMELTFPAYRRLRTDHTTAGKVPAILRYSTWQRTDGFEMYQMALAVVSKRRGYVVTGTTASQSSQLQAEATLLVHILRSFRTK